MKFRIKFNLALIQSLAVICFICSNSSEAESADYPTKNPLAGTDWRLVEFQSMDDSVGIKRPDDPSLYTMSLLEGGTVKMKLNCNRASGPWSAEPAGDGSSGRFEFGPLAMTRALCPPPSMDEHIASNASYIRSYLLKDGRLYLSLMADAGIYVWEPDASDSAAAEIPPAPWGGGPRCWEVKISSGSLNLREQASTGARIISRYLSGTILNNLGGCKAGDDGMVWCDVQELKGGPRGYVALNYIKPAKGPDGVIPMGEDNSALRAGQGDFDAKGNIPCAMKKGQPMGECEFGVARSGGGYAAVVVKKPDGLRRAIFFSLGIPVGADTSEADYGEFSKRKEGDLNIIQIGEERYEIPDAVILGG